MSNQKFEGAVTGKEGSYKDRTLLLGKFGVKYFFISRVNRFMWIRARKVQKQEFGILNSVKNMQCSRRRQAQYI